VIDAPSSSWPRSSRSRTALRESTPPGLPRWCRPGSLQGRPVGLVAVDAGIADPNIGAVGAQQRERTRFPAGLLQNLAAGGLGRFFTRVDPAAVQQPLA